MCTAAAYRQRAHKHVIPEFGSQRLEALTTPAIQRWVDRLVTQGMAPNTIDGVVLCLSSALWEAVRLGLIPTNPASGVRRPAPAQKEPQTWTTDEFARVLPLLAEEPMWDALYRTALATALRPGELRALRGADVDLERRQLVVRQTMTKDGDGRVVLGTRTKTRKPRAVALPPACVLGLRRWQAEQRRRRAAAAVWHALDLVFTRDDGNWLPNTTWQHFHEALVERAGVTAITPHELRHTNATIDLERGIHPKIVSDRLGHEKIETTLNIYSHVSADLQRAAADDLGRHLFGDDNIPGEDDINMQQH